MVKFVSGENIYGPKNGKHIFKNLGCKKWKCTHRYTFLYKGGGMTPGFTTVTPNNLYNLDTSSKVCIEKPGKFYRVFSPDEIRELSILYLRLCKKVDDYKGQFSLNRMESFLLKKIRDSQKRAFKVSSWVSIITGGNADRTFALYYCIKEKVVVLNSDIPF
ncbi:MAG: hypothetical protein MI862_12805 [Desulfobacterales bacterium]|nr:hypothetical protein [Desulfobacterales bacterium]